MGIAERCIRPCQRFSDLTRRFLGVTEFLENAVRLFGDGECICRLALFQMRVRNLVQRTGQVLFDTCVGRVGGYELVLPPSLGQGTEPVPSHRGLESLTFRAYSLLLEELERALLSDAVREARKRADRCLPSFVDAQ